MFQLAVLSWDGMVASVGKEKPFLFVCVLANYSRKKEVRHLISCMGIGKCCFYYYITCSQCIHEKEEPWNALLYTQTKRRLQIQMGCRFRYNTRKLLGDTRNLNSITTRERWYLIFYDSSSVSSRSQFLFSFFSKTQMHKNLVNSRAKNKQFLLILKNRVDCIYWKNKLL